MTNPLLIIISGHPSTGKTTLGKRLAQELNLCFISRDDLKESLFDNLGWKDREWSKKLGIASYKLLYHFIESLLVAGHSFIAESNFDPEYDTSRFLELKRKYGFNSFQVQCKTEALGDNILLLEHVGSTSVPGLSAKPIIDMVMAVANSSDESSYVKPLEARGYTLRIREPDWYKHRLLKSQEVQGNLHVFSNGCEEIEQMLLFRD